MRENLDDLRLNATTFLFISSVCMSCGGLSGEEPKYVCCATLGTDICIHGNSPSPSQNTRPFGIQVTLEASHVSLHIPYIICIKFRTNNMIHTSSYASTSRPYYPIDATCPFLFFYDRVTVIEDWSRYSQGLN